MLGSSSEAEDAVQETMTRAWRGYDRLEGRAPLRSGLYRIASNVCFDRLNASQRRARPMDLPPWGRSTGTIGEPLPEAAWIQPVPDGRVLPAIDDPAELAVARESIRLAFGGDRRRRRRRPPDRRDVGRQRLGLEVHRRLHGPGYDGAPRRPRGRAIADGRTIAEGSSRHPATRVPSRLAARNSARWR